MELGRASARQSALSIALVVAVVGLGATVPMAAAGDVDESRPGPAATVVRVLAQGCGWRRIGSGVVTSDGVLTNRHVVANAAAVRVELSDGRSEEVTSVRVAAALDLATLGVAGADAASWSHDPARVGDRVAVIGHPGGGRVEVRRGVVQAEVRGQVAPDPDRLWALSVAVAPGSSGSGVFDGSGRLVGLVYAAAVGDAGALVMRGGDIRAALGSMRLTPFLGCPD